LVLPWRPLRELMQRRRRLTNDEWRLLIWTIAPLLLFTASVDKQRLYMLPVLPPIAMMLGTGIANRVSSSRNRAASREVTGATLVTAVMFGVVGVLFYRGRVLFVSAYPAITWTGIVLVSIAAAALAATAITRSWRHLPAVMAVSAAVLLLTLQFGAFAG